MGYEKWNLYKLDFKQSITVLFLAMFSLVHFLKPPFIYDKKGAFREFGLGYKEKTVISMWVLSIILGILSYLVVSYYLMFGWFAESQKAVYDKECKGSTICVIAFLPNIYESNAAERKGYL